MLMFGICLLHAVGFGGYGKTWMVNVLTPCVVGFVFISGWYGIRFRWRKLVKLYGIGVYCAMVSGVLSVCGNEEVRSVDALKIALSHLSHGYWFLHAYAIMMMLAPLVNLAVPQGNGECNWRLLAPLWCVVFVWGFGRTLPYGSCLPKADGLDAYGGLTLLAIYAGARAVRESGVVGRVTAGHCAWIVALVLACCAFGAGDYNSPFAFVLSAGVFAVVSRSRFCGIMGEWGDRIVSWLGPSIFSVYLIHCNGFGLKMIRPIERFAVNEWGVHPCVAIVFTAVVLFAGSLILDLPRRALCLAFRHES